MLKKDFEHISRLHERQICRRGERVGAAHGVRVEQQDGKPILNAGHPSRGHVVLPFSPSVSHTLCLLSFLMSLQLLEFLLCCPCVNVHVQ